VHLVYEFYYKLINRAAVSWDQLLVGCGVCCLFHPRVMRLSRDGNGARINMKVARVACYQCNYFKVKRVKADYC